MRALVLGALVFAGAAAAQPLTPPELDEVVRLARARDAAAAHARFAGQGERLARHYLLHTGTPPEADDYFFVLAAVGGADAAALLARAFADPPQPESGPQFESSGKLHRLARHQGEIERALEAVLSHPQTAADAQAAKSLAEAIDGLRERWRGLGAGMAASLIAVLGRATGEEARALLRRYAADADAQVRAAALQALGRAGGKADATLLARTLTGDPAPRARIEAVRGLAALDPAQAAPALRGALAAEANPEVVDALLTTLAALKALPAEPAQCYELAGRAWELQAAALGGACWRAQADREALLRAALEGPPIRRSLALVALFAERSPPRLDDAKRRRLLASAAEALSQPLSQSAAYQVNERLLDIAGGDMALALEHADRIVSQGVRGPNEGRLAASHALSRQDPRAYAAARRLPQALLVAGLLAAVLLVAMMRAARPCAIAAAVPLAAWLAWTLATDAVRELPPLTLAPFTVFGSASLSAAAVCAAAAWRRGVLAGIGAVPAAAALAFLFCGLLRWYDVFPVGGEGWELILEPIGAALLAAVLATVATPAAALTRRFA